MNVPLEVVTRPEGTQVVDDESQRLAALCLEAGSRRYLAKRSQQRQKTCAGNDLRWQPGLDLIHTIHAKRCLRNLGNTGESVGFLSLCAPRQQLTTLSCLHSYPHLTSADVSGNRLVSLDALSALPRLVALNARSNRLRNCLDFAVPTGSQLREADLSGNLLCDSLCSLANHPQLQSLKIDKNCLISLKGIASVSHLRVLSAARNFVTEVPAMEHLRGLTHVDLSHNRIVRVAASSLPRSLSTIKLSHNLLAGVPTLRELPALGLAELHCNALHDFTALKLSLSGASSLRTLHLSPNPLCEKMVDFRPECLHLLPALRELDGTEVTTMEKVAAANLHAADMSQLLAIRQKHLQEEHQPEWFWLYQAQYRAAFAPEPGAGSAQ